MKLQKGYNQDSTNITIHSRNIVPHGISLETLEEVSLEVDARTYKLDPRSKSKLIEAVRTVEETMMQVYDERNIKYSVFWTQETDKLENVDWIASRLSRYTEMVDRGLLTQKQVDDFFATIDPNRLAKARLELAKCKSV
jgi:hypothetical protein